MENNMVPVNNENAINNPVTKDDETTLIPTSVQMSTARTRPINDKPSDKVPEDMIKVTTEMIKEGAATAKDNRIMRKKMVDSSINVANMDLEILKTEYNRLVDILSNSELQSEERIRLEERAETISDRIHESAQAHQEDMRQNTPPPQKGIPVWGWIALIATGVLSGFAIGRCSTSRH